MIIKCKMCGGDLRPAGNATTCECEYCGSVQTIPKLDNERRLNLYDRANHFRRNNEYDKAMGIFEQILQDDRTDAEAYWSLVLCRYGIEYVEDPATKKHIPTVNRAQFDSVFADEDYKSALEYADAVQKGIYEEEAKAIDDIQKGILDISKKEKPFDVFICYKETDAEGRRTPDSVLANDLYHQLTREGIKVFYAKITLEDKLGQQYEPYIFAALNSAKVMVVLGTKPEYFNAVWVKNEWSRYLKLIKSGANKTLVPAYKDMDPYDLPEEFSHLQAQDMSKLGFMQDLIHGIKKIAGQEKPAATQEAAVPIILDVPMKANVQSLLGRAFMALEDGEWSKADDFCEQVLNQDFQNARAYVGKLMAELKIRKESDLQYQPQPIERSGNYQKALRFADDKLKTQLAEANDAIKNRAEEYRMQGIYNEAISALNSARTVTDVQSIKGTLSAITSYKDTAKGLKACDEKIESINSSAYNKANDLMKQQQYTQAAAAFRVIGNYRDCQTVAKKCDELEALRQSEEAATRAEQTKRDAERKAKEEAERKEKERVTAELKARQDEIARREAEAKAAKAKKTGIILAFAAVLCVAGFFVFTKVIQPKMNYDNAIKAMQAGQYDAAITAFTELGDYEDCGYRIQQAQANKAFEAGQYDTVGDIYATLPKDYQDHAADFVTMYNDAVALVEDSKYDEAIAVFTKLGNYSDSKTQISEAIYRKACSLEAVGSYDEAISLYALLDGYSDSQSRSAMIKADRLYDAGNYAGAYAVYATLSEGYQTHAADYAAMYDAAEINRTSGNYDTAYDRFIALGTYSDAENKAVQCRIDKANAFYTAEKYNEAAEVYALIGNTEKAAESTYRYAGQLVAQGEYLQGAQQYETIMSYEDSQEQHYQTGLQACVNGKLADAYTILSADSGYRDAKEMIYQIGVSASNERLYEVSVLAFTQVGAYKDAAMKLTMDTYAMGGQLFDNADYDKSAEVFISMGEFADAPVRANEAYYAAAGVAMSNGRYDEASTRYTALGNYNDSADKAKAAAYAAAKEQLETGNYADAKTRFTKLGNYSNAADMVQECDYIPAKALYEAKEYSNAFYIFRDNGLAGYKDSDTLMNDCCYRIGKEQMIRGLYENAVTWFNCAGDYSDSNVQAAECHRLIALAKAQTYEANGDYENAYVQYELAGEITKMQETAYQTALVKISGSDYESAIAWYEKAGTYSDAKKQILSIGEYYYSTQQYDLAEAVYVKVPGVGAAAQRLYELGRYYELGGNNERAAQCYREAGVYEDAPEKAVVLQNEVDYQKAESLFLASDWEGALTLYTKITGYRDAESKAMTCENEMATIAVALAAARRAELTTAGNTLKFGAYEQDNDESNGKEAIEWIVLKADDNNVFVLSKYILDAQKYNSEWQSMNWKNCTLRSWLNSRFLNLAFSPKEQDAILTTEVDNSNLVGYGYSRLGGPNTQDKVFLLSYNEVSGNWIATATPYAEARLKYKNNQWWLRSAASSQGYAYYIKSDGSDEHVYVNETYGVRPALWINLESEGFQSYIQTGVWE